jgi:hypothetical protein
VTEADWIADRLDDWASRDAAIVVPRGFDAYVRLLHPADGGHPEHRPVRWAEIADWSGLELRPDSGFESVALPLDDRGSPKPWTQRSRRGSLPQADLAELVDVLRRHTEPAADCFFCIWDGYGWERRVPLTRRRRWRRWRPAEPLPDPVPKEVRDGPRVELPNRYYLLYQGPLDDAMACIETEHQSPNLWWPQDRSWCVATGIDLTWTYVGGSKELAAELRSDPRLEAQASQPDDPLHGDDDRLLAVATSAARDLLAGRDSTIVTGVGTMRVWLGPSRVGPLAFNHERLAEGGGRGSSRIDVELTEEMLTRHVMTALTALAR